MKNVSLSSSQELEKLKAQASYIHELEEREKELIAELSDNHEVVWHLRVNPKFLEGEEWKRLENVANKIYKNYTHRLKQEFPALTELGYPVLHLVEISVYYFPNSFYYCGIFLFRIGTEESFEEALAPGQSPFV